MKKILSITMICFTLFLITSCSSSEDEGKLPNISFKTGGVYTSSDVSLAAKSAEGTCSLVCCLATGDK